ncbi:response regulator [Rhizobium sophorae]|uniref:Response regulator n=1 Tax=Rhizobium sophorae TaxID=1535242 RepID=A0A7Y3S8W6_9HYPH|nr:response regulator [Rhizobium sophorae]MBX4863468.1 response regulator [Rhizobium bangladeshense]NKK74640.1 response regulator [Rhizobium leguminosarum bv. viciae]NKL32657.1 response regulator [Rhizobium leguminosarum bv. viciae]NNU38012.1 response regulator [Rhizobium sophorae]
MVTVLCIEDEVEIRNLLVEELSEAGYKTLEASNGAEGLEVILSKWPDIVISDISMPVMDGHQLLAEIQINHPELSNIPFILLTALTDRENTLTGLRGGAADYLTKPLDFDLLLAKLEGCVTRLANDKAVHRSF